MNARRLLILVLFGGVTLLILGALTTAGAQESPLTPKEELGKSLFFDKNLSAEGNQACAACHDPAVGYTGPNQEVNTSGGVYPGSVAGRYGNRKPPAAAYAGSAPNLHYDKESEAWFGGMFWDGRATGDTLGDPLAEQAQGPFLNPLEQALPDAQALCLKVKASSYAKLFEEVWGAGSLDCEKDVTGTYERIARSIAAYERSSEVNPFTSKYDYYLAGKATLTAQEALGLELFNGKANCANCHVSQPGPNGEPPVFTDFTYDNLGSPKNPANPFYTMPAEFNPDGANWVDYGLGAYLKSAGQSADVYEPEMGKHKVPTLRNVALAPSADVVKAYGHNGYFKSLEQIVHFYNTRDVGDWPEPEVSANMNTEELGNLGLTQDEEAALVAFLKTLSDGYQP
jgi:cytochrome c peroxidase